MAKDNIENHHPVKVGKYTYRLRDPISFESPSGGFYSAMWDERYDCLMLKQILQKGYDEETYFPMHEYNNGLKKVNLEIDTFLNNRDFYENNSLKYKRSILMFSVPGTGKTRYIQYKCGELIESRDAIVITARSRNSIFSLVNGLELTNYYLRDRLKIIVIEELGELCEETDTKVKLMHLLDSPQVSKNTLIISTTNHPELIPKNIIDRPSRLDVVQKIAVEDYTDSFVLDWFKFHMGESLDENIINEDWFDDAKRQLTPVYWSELFKFAHLQDVSLEAAWSEIVDRKKSIEESFSDRKSIGFGK